MKDFFLPCIVIFLFMTNLSAQWEPDFRLTYNDSTSHTSYTNARCVAANGDIVNVVWNDNRDGNYEIYYKRNPTGNTIQEKPSDIATRGNRYLKVLPNPFTNNLRIKDCSKVKIYNISGKYITKVQHTWNGKDNQGIVVPPGIYFLKANGVNVGKVVKVR